MQIVCVSLEVQVDGLLVIWLSAILSHDDGLCGSAISQCRCIKATTVNLYCSGFTGAIVLNAGLILSIALVTSLLGDNHKARASSRQPSAISSSEKSIRRDGHRGSVSHVSGLPG